MTGFRTMAWAQTLGLLLVLSMLQPGVCLAAGARGHKVQANSPADALQLEAQGGRLVADYGSFRLYEIAQLLVFSNSSTGVEIHDEYNFVQLNAVRLDTSQSVVQSLRRPLGKFSGKRLHLVQFAGPIKPEWQAALLATGAQIVDYIPHNAYLVYGDALSLAQLQAMATSAPEVQWEASYADDYKLHPRARSADHRGRAREIGTDLFAVQLVADPEANAATLRLLDSLKREPIRRQDRLLHYLNIVLRVSPKDLVQVAAQPEVISIQPYYPPQKFCERQDQIIAGNLWSNAPSGPGYLAWLASKGFTQAQFTASGFVVDVTDSGLDNGTTAPNHFGLYTAGSLTNSSRIAYARLEGTPNGGSTLAGCDGHGTLNGHIVGGYSGLFGFPYADGSGYHFGLGVCPFVALGSSVIFDPNMFTSPDFNDLQSEAYQSGARISNNSWGNPVGGVYDMVAQNFDALVRDAQPPNSTYPTAGDQEMVIVVAAGNAGPATNSIASPATAKNVISVGAAANVQPFGAPDGSGITDAQASNANDLVSFSSQGACLDGRHKPDLVAPGTHISGGVIQSTNVGPNGTADPCFCTSGCSLSGGPFGDPFFPAGQQFYTASSGTSHSTPCVSGGCALVRQYFINNWGYPPSPAMTKAYLMNSARYLTGAYANDTLWSDAQGMGEMDLGMAFDGAARFLRDENSIDFFTATGQSRTYTGSIADTNKPFRVTLAWTDAHGNTTGAAYNNNLDLTVAFAGNVYKGNVFNGPFSVPGGSADPANNVESVFLPSGLSGPFAITVTAANINSDSISNNTYDLDQDFALVAYNANVDRVPVLVASGWSLLAESCFPTNGGIDPGEAVAVSFSLQNLGTCNTTNLVATLLSGNGISAPSAPQSYGSIAAEAPPVSHAFSFTASGSCGGNITANLHLQDGSADLGIVSFSLPLGQPLPSIDLSENFDAVSTPAFPSNWSGSSWGAVSNWITSTDFSDTPPNAAYVAQAPVAGVSELLSPVINITSTAARLTFQNNINADADSFYAYDGGVLEIKIGNQNFSDILAAGGNFVSGGYTLTVDPSGDNPLAGRQAWSSSYGGFINTVVNLPVAAAGQKIQLKWRLGTDTGDLYTTAGWWCIDTVSIQDYRYSCCTQSNNPPSILLQPASQSALPGSNITFQVTAAGSPPLHYQWLYNGTNLSGATNNPLRLSNVQPGQIGPYALVVTNLSGSVTSAIANLAVLVSPRIAGVQPSLGKVTLTLSSWAGLHYALEYKSKLGDPQWLPVTPALQGTGGIIVLTDTNPPSTSRFYRVRCY